MNPRNNFARPRQQTGRRLEAGQRGVAAIELALVLGVLLLLMYGLIGFGLLFWVQQKVEHIAGDSARHATVVSMSGHANPAQAGCDYVSHHVSADRVLSSLGVGSVVCVPSTLGQPCVHEPSELCAVITVTANMAAWKVFKPVRVLARASGARDGMSAIDQLSATAIVRVKGA